MRKLIMTIAIVMVIVLITGCSLSEVKTADGIVPFLFPTKGAKIDKDGTLYLSTSVEENNFNAVVLQLYSDSPLTFIENINSSMEGKQKGVFENTLDTGEYLIMLKANSNKQDEGVSLKVYLEKGKSYVYTYNVKSFSQKEVTIKDFAFGMK